VEIKSIPNKLERVESLYNGDVDLLVNVPPDAVEEIKERGFPVAMMPSLEVGFVMFNLSDPVFGQKSVRMAVAKGLNRESFLDLAYGYAKTVNQFVSNGVFGYNPDLKGFEYDQLEAEKELTKSVAGFKKVDVQIFYPASLKLFGKYFQEQLALIGMNVELAPVTDQELQEKLIARVLPFYYLGWRNDSGDALPFLKSVIHSRKEGVYGIYNGMNYVNKKVDQLIEDSETNFSISERQKDMQEAMKIVVEDDVVGVPLFETQSLFAYNSSLSFKPRVDSLVYPSTIRKNN
jgi:ABC-type transport system substrate-binding protein